MAPRMKRVAAVERPAAAIWGRERRGSVMATAATDFIGWTGIGMPKRNPVEMLYRAVKMRVVERSRWLTSVRARTMGM